MQSLKPPKVVAEKTNPAQAAGEEQNPLSAPTYYEVWGGLESANRALWVGLWFSCTVSILLLILLRIEIRRPPVVIRLDASGQTQTLTDASAQPAVSEAEIKNFLTLFERFFTELNYYTYDSNLKQAFAMMTKDFQSKANDMIKNGGVVEKLKNNQGKTTLILTEISIVRDTPQSLECRVKGYREIGSYKSDVAASEVVFEDDVVLRKMPRSEEAPSGLLVEDYAQSFFKK